MNIKKITKIHTGQDGTIYGKWLFRLSADGCCKVYDLSGINTEADTAETPVSVFTLNKAELIVPHSNAVTFGKEFFAPDDEFPLLYSNIYNNYAKAEDTLCGVCCVYRIVRDGLSFSSTLVQIIRVGFTDDRRYWRSEGEVVDTRPYGNLVVDRDGNRLYAFVMRDGAKSTRYFAFDLPDLSDGEMSDRFGVPYVVLGIDDIKEYFDTPYHHYLQGACCRGGKIYSVEGFNANIRPCLRIIDLKEKKQIFESDLFEEGLTHEAEFIDFYGDSCYYSDSEGNIFELDVD